MKRAKPGDDKTLHVPGDKSPSLRSSNDKLGLTRQKSADLRTIPHDETPVAISERFGAVVMVQVSYVRPDYLRPWQKSRQESCRGTGFAIEGRRIITNFHVVENATDIRLRKHGQAKRWPGRVLCAAQDVDLAIIEVPLSH